MGDMRILRMWAHTNGGDHTGEQTAGKSQTQTVDDLAENEAKVEATTVGGGLGMAAHGTQHKEYELAMYGTHPCTTEELGGARGPLDGG